MSELLSYYEINKMLWRWRKQDGARIVDEAKLSMDAAPPLPPEPPKPPAPKPASAPKRDSLDKMADDFERIGNAFSRFKRWLDTPDPPKPKPPLKVEPTIPPFDIQEIPDAMRREMMPVGAKLMERWFAGRLNYSTSSDDQKHAIDQNGKPYADDMYDYSIVKLDWVLKHRRAKEKYDQLIEVGIYSPDALKILRESLSAYYDHYGFFRTAEVFKDDVRMMHEMFQFQRATVDGGLADKIKSFMYFTEENKGVPDDLFASLGSFNICAAVAQANFYIDERSRSRCVDIIGIFVYVKDGYTFEADAGKSSQYLGHWGENGIIVVPYSFVSSRDSRIPQLNYPVAVGDVRKKRNLYYPVRNSDFREWQKKHKRGGDFIIFSDKKFVRLDKSIRVFL
ncbi:hypothetical protein DIE15_05360 [Burkholderia sp. Bp9031]|uniref:DUF6402 family protein n=1 Tax=Burkholderia sp. Bp9031 TaxID=2184566 RepID=UPI000F5F206C|nr:DUF6402 family protein [Burkholderia sp. Bp9031]RQZ19157.1 hypothetical protein DIE15_05360 [Burkholderia sp. Bp9031]